MSDDRTYSDNDLVIPLLVRDGKLGSPRDSGTCRVEIVLRDKDVILRVGPRDFQWDRGSGKLVAKGTDIRQAA